MALPVFINGAPRLLSISIKTRDVELNRKLRRAIYSNVRTALGRFRKRIRDVAVWVEDTNGPRDGSGMRCRMEISLARGGRINAEAEAGNEFAAVAECANRARTLLVRHVQKRHGKRRAARVSRAAATT